MEVFNLADKLIEERKKNKDLEIVNKNAKQIILDYQEKTYMLINSNCQLNEYIEQLEEKIKELKADYGNKAQVERDLLQIKIDKAIEYIEKEYNKYLKNYDSYQCWLEDLLNILKGEII